MSGGTGADVSGPAAAGAEPVRLVRLDRRTPETALLRRAVLRHRLPPGQRGHVKPPVTTLPAADADPARTPFAVTAAGLPVADAAGARAVCAGFGVLDRAVHVRDLVPDPARAVLLRAFYLTTAWQGRGVGRAVCSAPLLDRLASDVAPHATELVLCVNEANHAASRVYRAAGFAFTGHRLLDGTGETQSVMTRPLATED
ncbi:GNAT family N-acetyltransferase [Nocardiopsis quinghaiensis]|uniref:GNAT family N-acetyltransferase n=1 Tax=Nocardiopsis quinghaiensis TaxID=464995 RepID=UPI001CC23657|nr:GNAT family protein [Nocardiopsis quinghaiensis]